jgi:hypothetical protein
MELCAAGTLARRSPAQAFFLQFYLLEIGEKSGVEKQFNTMIQR